MFSRRKFSERLIFRWHVTPHWRCHFNSRQLTVLTLLVVIKFTFDFKGPRNAFSIAFDYSDLVKVEPTVFPSFFGSIFLVCLFHCDFSHFTVHFCSHSFYRSIYVAFSFSHFYTIERNKTHGTFYWHFQQKREWGEKNTTCAMKSIHANSTHSCQSTRHWFNGITSID